MHVRVWWWLVRATINRVLPKSSRNSSVPALPLTEISLRLYPLRSSPFGIDTSIPAGFPWSEALLEVISRQRLHHVLRFGLDLFNAVKTLPLELKFYLWEQEKKNHRGRNPLSREDGGWPSFLWKPKIATQRATRESGRFHDAGSRSCCAACLDVWAGCFLLSRLRTSQ